MPTLHYLRSLPQALLKYLQRTRPLDQLVGIDQSQINSDVHQLVLMSFQTKQKRNQNLFIRPFLNILQVPQPNHPLQISLTADDPDIKVLAPQAIQVVQLSWLTPSTPMTLFLSESNFKRHQKFLLAFKQVKTVILKPILVNLGLRSAPLNANRFRVLNLHSHVFRIEEFKAERMIYVRLSKQQLLNRRQQIKRWEILVRLLVVESEQRVIVFSNYNSQLQKKLKLNYGYESIAFASDKNQFLQSTLHRKIILVAEQERIEELAEALANHHFHIEEQHSIEQILQQGQIIADCQRYVYLPDGFPTAMQQKSLRRKFSSYQQIYQQNQLQQACSSPLTKALIMHRAHVYPIRQQLAERRDIKLHFIQDLLNPAWVFYKGTQSSCEGKEILKKIQKNVPVLYISQHDEVMSHCKLVVEEQFFKQVCELQVGSVQIIKVKGKHAIVLISQRDYQGYQQFLKQQAERQGWSYFKIGQIAKLKQLESYFLEIFHQKRHADQLKSYARKNKSVKLVQLSYPQQRQVLNLTGEIIPGAVDTKHDNLCEQLNPCIQTLIVVNQEDLEKVIERIRKQKIKQAHIVTNKNITGFSTESIKKKLRPQCSQIQEHRTFILSEELHYPVDPQFNGQKGVYYFNSLQEISRATGVLDNKPSTFYVQEEQLPAMSQLLQSYKNKKLKKLVVSQERPLQFWNLSSAERQYAGLLASSERIHHLTQNQQPKGLQVYFDPLKKSHTASSRILIKNYEIRQEPVILKNILQAEQEEEGSQQCSVQHVLQNLSSDNQILHEQQVELQSQNSQQDHQISRPLIIQNQLSQCQLIQNTFANNLLQEKTQEHTFQEPLCQLVRKHQLPSQSPRSQQQPLQTQQDQQIHNSYEPQKQNEEQQQEAQPEFPVQSQIVQKEEELLLDQKQQQFSPKQPQNLQQPPSQQPPSQPQILQPNDQIQPLTHSLVQQPIISTLQKIDLNDDQNQDEIQQSSVKKGLQQDVSPASSSRKSLQLLSFPLQKRSNQQNKHQLPLKLKKNTSSKLKYPRIRIFMVSKKQNLIQVVKEMQTCNPQQIKVIKKLPENLNRATVVIGDRDCLDELYSTHKKYFGNLNFHPICYLQTEGQQEIDSQYLGVQSQDQLREEIANFVGQSPDQSDFRRQFEKINYQRVIAYRIALSQRISKDPRVLYRTAQSLKELQTLLKCSLNTVVFCKQEHFSTINGSVSNSYIICVNEYPSESRQIESYLNVIGVFKETSEAQEWVVDHLLEKELNRLCRDNQKKVMRLQLEVINPDKYAQLKYLIQTYNSQDQQIVFKPAKHNKIKSHSNYILSPQELLSALSQARALPDSRLFVYHPAPQALHSQFRADDKIILVTNSLQDLYSTCKDFLKAQENHVVSQKQRSQKLQVLLLQDAYQYQRKLGQAFIRLKDRIIIRRIQDNEIQSNLSFYFRPTLVIGGKKQKFKILQMASAYSGSILVYFALMISGAEQKQVFLKHSNLIGVCYNEIGLQESIYACFNSSHQTKQYLNLNFSRRTKFSSIAYLNSKRLDPVLFQKNNQICKRSIVETLEQSLSAQPDLIVLPEESVKQCLQKLQGVQVQIAVLADFPNDYRNLNLISNKMIGVARNHSKLEEQLSINYIRKPNKVTTRQRNQTYQNVQILLFRLNRKEQSRLLSLFEEPLLSKLSVCQTLDQLRISIRDQTIIIASDRNKNVIHQFSDQNNQIYQFDLIILRSQVSREDPSLNLISNVAAITSDPAEVVNSVLALTDSHGVLNIQEIVSRNKTDCDFFGKLTAIKSPQKFKFLKKRFGVLCWRNERPKAFTLLREKGTGMPSEWGKVVLKNRLKEQACKIRVTSSQILKRIKRIN